MISNRNLRAHRITGLEPGPRLIVTGAVHGNETAGTQGIRRVLAQIDGGEIEISRGSVTFVPVCNPLAYNLQRRMGDRNLNRRLQPTATPQDFEDRLARVLCAWLAEHEVLLDLHSFRSPGQPFVMRGPADNAGTLEPFAHAAAEARLAAHAGPSRVVEGWMAAYADGVARRKARALTPGAVHDDPAGADVAAHAIRQTLALLGLTDDIRLQPPQAPFECLRLAEVIDRHAEGDAFVKPWTSFTPLAEGELIARRADGSELRAPQAGYIVFPDVSALPGHEWFYLAQASDRPL
jgi:predicted deacylase